MGGPGPASAGELGDLVTRAQEKEKGHRRKREAGRPREARGHAAEPTARQVSGPDGVLDFAGVSTTPCRCPLLRRVFRGETASRGETLPDSGADTVGGSVLGDLSPSLTPSGLWVFRKEPSWWAGMRVGCSVGGGL